MRLLAVETSSLTGAVALLDGETVVAECRLNVSVTHGERLLATIDRVLVAARWRLEDLDALAVATGPGSFTGLRIGVATLKGLAFATGKPVVAVPTLDALAWSLPFAAHPVCPVLDARRGEVYTALYRTRDGWLERLSPYRAVEPRALAEELAREAPGPIVLLGDGAMTYRTIWTEVLGAAACLAPGSHRLPSAASLGLLALAAFRRGETTDPATLTPLYVRPSEAEAARERRQHAGQSH